MMRSESWDVDHGTIVIAQMAPNVAWRVSPRSVTRTAGAANDAAIIGHATATDAGAKKIVSEAGDATTGTIAPGKGTSRKPGISENNGNCKGNNELLQHA